MRALTLTQATAIGEQALTVHHEIGHRLGEARNLPILGRAAYARGQFDTARDHWQPAHALFVDIGAPKADEAAALGLVQQSPS